MLGREQPRPARLRSHHEHRRRGPLVVKATYPLPQYVHGISIDYYGYVWGVSMASEAYRVDVLNPAAFQTFTGLVGAYTYSDMTGVALSNVSPQ